MRHLRKSTPASLEKLALIEELFGLVESMCPQKIASITQFARQTIQLHDDEAVATFLKWKEDPVIDSILLLAAKLDSDGREDLLDTAEILADENSGRRPTARSM